MRLFFLIVLSHQCLGRGLDPPQDELTQALRSVRHQVVTSRQELIDEVELVRSATRAYIGTKIKENLLEVR